MLPFLLTDFRAEVQYSLHNESTTVRPSALSCVSSKDEFIGHEPLSPHKLRNWKLLPTEAPFLNPKLYFVSVLPDPVLHTFRE